MKARITKIKPQKDLKSRLLNVSIPRAVLDEVGDVVSVLIVKYVHHRFVLNDKKPVWLKIDRIHDNIPFLSRAGLAKKLKKLVDDGHIIEKKGEGRHYHKNWYSTSKEMQAVLNRKSATKVYYNLDLAEQNIEAAVIYATILNLLKTDGGWWESREYGRMDDSLMLDTGKLVAGTGLSIYKVRKAINWLIDNKKITGKKVFGNKWLVNLTDDLPLKLSELNDYFREVPPAELFLHTEPEQADPTEIYPHA